MPFSSLHDTLQPAEPLRSDDEASALANSLQVRRALLSPTNNTNPEGSTRNASCGASWLKRFALFLFLSLILFFFVDSLTARLTIQLIESAVDYLTSQDLWLILAR